MNNAGQQSQENMRREIYATIRRNLFRYGESLSRHQLVEVLAEVLAGQVEIIRDDAKKKRIL
jgi:hypothetical protein